MRSAESESVSAEETGRGRRGSECQFPTAEKGNKGSEEVGRGRGVCGLRLPVYSRGKPIITRALET